MDNPQKAGSLIGTFLLCCAPVLVIPAFITLILTRKAWPEMRTMLHAARYQRILEMIQARGDVPFTEIANELDLNLEQTVA
jgi:hypothetical protein